MPVTSLPSVDCLCLEMRKKIIFNTQQPATDFYITTLLSFYGKKYKCTVIFYFFYESDTIWRCFQYNGTNEIEFQVVTYDHLFESCESVLAWCYGCVHGVGKWTWEKRKKEGKNNKFLFCEWMQWLPQHSVFNFFFLRHCCCCWYYLVFFIMIVSILY